MAMRVIVIANDGDGDPGWVGEHLRQVHGAELVRCWREDVTSWPDLHGVDLVVSLGSDWSVYWDHVQDSVQAEAALIHAAHDAARPVLGICFGAQITALALGGSVQTAPQPEVGWFGIDLLGDAPFDSGPWFQWHGDRITPPPGASVLATSPAAVQAFASQRTLAVQFHPEVTQAMVQRWASGGGVAELERLGVDRDAVLTDTARLADTRRHAAGRIVDSVIAGTL
jgi:GMP synthase-like glutamine amidotransferase